MMHLIIRSVRQCANPSGRSGCHRMRRRNKARDGAQHELANCTPIGNDTQVVIFVFLFQKDEFKGIGTNKKPCVDNEMAVH
ncbi:hypothetical protein NDU88_004539 [Pleurodeles waltl]|uniref:Uncharacterized protein n=1 Tax=Pleurodeles waltl TaxID=8319 RepID=A0AAV7NLC4_PLEWA|nr:hypothetical protein NDU88_004539 [Pleurodeles waltl]